MRITIDIPEAFTKDWEKDRFEDCLMRLCTDANCLAGNYEKETAKMLVEAFKEASVNSGETSDDCIDRKKAVYVASGYCHPANIAKELAKLPPVTPAAGSGEWIYVEDRYGEHVWKCSKCMVEETVSTAASVMTGVLYPQWKFCPNCGASLKGGKNV